MNDESGIELLLVEDTPQVHAYLEVVRRLVADGQAKELRRPATPG
jgi:hypothetical protein